MFRDTGASFRYAGDAAAFKTEAKVEAMDGQEVTAELDFMRSTWRRLQVTGTLTTPLEGWATTTATYRHTANTGQLLFRTLSLLFSCMQWPRFS